MKSIFSDVIGEFGRRLGVDSVEFDEDDTCIIVFDDIVVSLRLINDGEQLLIYSQIGDVPEEDELGFYRELLSANFVFQNTNGATLGLERGSRTVALALMLDATACNLVRFEAALESFVNTAEHWMRKIPAMTVGEESPSTEESDADFGIRV